MDLVSHTITTLITILKICSLTDNRRKYKNSFHQLDGSFFILKPIAFKSSQVLVRVIKMTSYSIFSAFDYIKLVIGRSIG